MNYYLQMSIIVIYGGRNDSLYKTSGDAYLQDISILNLENLNWCNVSTFDEI